MPSKKLHQVLVERKKYSEVSLVSIPRKTNMKVEQNNNLNMHLLSEIVILHCHVSYRRVEIDVVFLFFNANCMEKAQTNQELALQPASTTLPETNM